MPKFSKETLEAHDYGPVLDRQAEVDGYTVNITAFQPGHRRDAADEGPARRPLPLPALGLRDQGPS